MKPNQDLLTRIQEGLPASVGPWSASGEDAVHDLESLYGYIDGHAEVYRAYGVERCLARKYVRSDAEELVLDVFLMPSAADAYGVFTHDLDGEATGLGRGARIRPGWLSLWQGRVFVSVFTADDSAEATEDLLALGSRVAELLPDGGDLPAVLDLLPEAGLDGSSVRYLYDPMILGTHLFVGFDNPLGLGPGTPAALAHFDRGGLEARLLLVEYPDEAAAVTAMAAAREGLLDGADGDLPTQTEHGSWRGARLSGRALIVVVDAENAEMVTDLLYEAPTGHSEDRRKR